MKKISFCFWLMLGVFTLNAQRDSLVVINQMCFGGNLEEGIYCSKIVNDTLLFIGGMTNSTQGDIYQLYGEKDAFGIFVDSNLTIKKKMVFGGEKTEKVKNIIALPSQSMYMILYESNSLTGEYASNRGDYDVYYRTYNYAQHWFSPLKQMGGNQKDEIWGVSAKNNDMGLLIFGGSASNNGDLPGNYGGNDAWIVNLSQTYTINWSKNYGGSSSDVFVDGYQLGNGDILAFGSTLSNDNQVQGNNGVQDIWVVRLNSMGDIVWQKCLGGTDMEILLSVKKLSDDLFMLIGVSNSYNGSFYMIKYQQPNISHYYGFYYVMNSNGDFIRGAIFNNPNNDVLLTDGVVDGMDVRLYGSMLGKPLFVDFENNWLNTQTYVSINGLVGEISYCDKMGGSDYYVNITNSSELPNYTGGTDVVVMKVKKELIVGENFVEGVLLNVYPNPVKELLWLNGSFEGKSFEIVDLTGKIMKTGFLVDKFVRVDELNGGVYLFRIYCDGYVYVEKFVKE